MKRLLIATALLLAAGFVGCTKNDDATVSKDIKVKFAVADKDVFSQTRAVKSDWADGDQIFILFKVAGNALVTENSNDNTIILTYNKSADTWALTKNNWGDELTNSTSGDFLAVHYRGAVGIGAYDRGDYCFANFLGGEVLKMKGQYTITDGEMILPTLALEMESNVAQFSVKGLASHSDTWQLLVNHDEANASDYTASDSASPVAAFNKNVQFRPTNMDCAYVNAQWMAGVVNGDDLSFCGKLDNQNDNATTNYMFILKNESGDYYYFNYQPTPFEKFTGKTAYLLPPLTLKGDGSVASGCLWTAF